MWSKAEKHLARDKYIGDFVATYGPCKIIPRDEKYYFEDLVDAIIQQQLSIKAAKSIFEKVKGVVAGGSKYVKGKHKWREGETVETDLTPDKVLAVSDSTLRKCGLSYTKVEYVKGLASDIIEGKLDLFRLKELEDEMVREVLTLVRGIGDWTVDMFLMFSLARPDVFPVGDLGLRRAFRKTVGKDIKAEEMVEFALRWIPYRTVASWYLWASLENK